MALCIEVTINNGDPVIAGFNEPFFGLATTVSVVNHHERGEDIGIVMGGMVKDSRNSVNWLNQTLKAGDELRIRIVEDGSISPVLPDNRNEL